MGDCESAFLTTRCAVYALSSAVNATKFMHEVKVRAFAHHAMTAGSSGAPRDAHAGQRESDAQQVCADTQIDHTPQSRRMHACDYLNRPPKEKV